MLVLTRKVGESIMIGDDVVITVVEMRGEVARIGIAAPRHVRVHREEIYREVAAANAAAATVTGDDASRIAALVAARSAATTQAGASSSAAVSEGPPTSAAVAAGVPKPGPRKPRPGS